MERETVCFFLGANTPGGFLGYMPESYSARDGWRVYILKGGAGTGKSTFMRRLLERVRGEIGDTQAEEILCSSDPSSLDGVRFADHKVAVFDGTAPHPLEPRYWGVCERVVDIGKCADGDILYRHAKEIMDATDACAECHGRCRQYLATAAALLQNRRRAAWRCTDTDKVRRAAARIAQKEFRGGVGGGEQRRFLSAVTPEGEMVLYSTLQAMCPRLYVIEDEYGAAGALMLEELRRHALAAGEELITCRCPLFPTDKIEHLILPQKGVGFTLSDPFHKADFPVYRRLHAERFMADGALRESRQRLAFERKAAREFLTEAASAVKEAKSIHDEMERYSRQAMDFSAADNLFWQVSDEILHHMKVSVK